MLPFIMRDYSEDDAEEDVTCGYRTKAKHGVVAIGLQWSREFWDSSLLWASRAIKGDIELLGPLTCFLLCNG